MADIPVDQRISFSSVSREDLDKVRCKNGLERGATHHRRVRYLWSRIQDINRHVNMDVDLLTTLWIRFNERQYWRSHDSWCSSIFIGENRVVGRNEAWCGHFTREENSLGERVNPISLYGIWLTGNVDYALLQYADEKDNKGQYLVIRKNLHLIPIKGRLLGVDNSRGDTFKLARGRLFLVEAKRLREHDGSLASHMPEAVSQAIALAQLTR